MRRLVPAVLVAVTATALLTGLSGRATAEEISPPSASSSDPTATPGSAGVDPAELLRSTAGTAPVTAAARREATEALDSVQEVFAPKTPAAAARQAATGADPTLVLRDLSLRLNALGRADRNSALAQFQRPWDDGDPHEATLSAGSNITLHYLPTALNAGNANATSAVWASTAQSVLANVSRLYQSSGYRLPRADAPTEYDPGSAYHGSSVNWGGSARTDVYLADLGDQGVYGYCAYDLDDSGRLVFYPPNGAGGIPAFCVLDNDFSPTQYRPTYRGETPTDFLKVTAAHEYFHAVQFAYDAFEDAWFMEATATWAEHQAYPAIPDNRQFLPYSQLRFPGVSLDTWNGNRGFLQYGDWIFFEYLTERLPARTGGLPNLVLKMWQYADSLGPDQYSIQAVASALAWRHQSFPTVFAQYAAANRRPSRTYRGGGAYPIATPSRTVVAGAHKRRKGSYKIDHLASVTVRLRPHKIRKAAYKATLSVDLANKSLGSGAVATVFFKNGRQTVKAIKLTKKGKGKVRVAFSTRKVAFVELTLVNANRSYRSCSANRRGYSCGGQPTHDNAKATWSLKS